MDSKKKKITQNKRFYILIPFLEMSVKQRNTYKYTFRVGRMVDGQTNLATTG